MQGRGLTPDVITYSASISACEKGSRWQETLMLLTEVRRQAIDCEADMLLSWCTSCIVCCFRQHGRDTALRLLEQFLQEGLALNCTSAAIESALVREEISYFLSE